MNTPNDHAANLANLRQVAATGSQSRRVPEVSPARGPSPGGQPSTGAAMSGKRQGPGRAEGVGRLRADFGVRV
jgi:hypothetical protein